MSPHADNEITLRRMTVDDLEEVSRLGISSKASWGYSSDLMHVFSKELTLDATKLRELIAAQVACKGEQILGYFTLRTHSDGINELEHLFVHAKHFVQRIGSLLLEAALASAAEHGVRKLTVIADPNTVDFYQRFGAKRVGEHQSSIPGRVIPMLEFVLDQPR